MGDNGNNEGSGIAGSPHFVTFDDCQRTQRIMINKFSDVEKRVERMDTALFGADGTSQTGILSIIRTNQNEILTFKIQNRIVWYVGALVVGIVASLITTYLSSFMR